MTTITELLNGTVYVLVTGMDGTSREWFLSPQEWSALVKHMPRDADNVVKS